MITNRIKLQIKSKKYLLRLIQVIRMLHQAKVSKISGLNKKHPRVLQFPITNKCNSKCVMCNVWKMDNSNEMSPGELEGFLQDSIFKKVQSVGVNGGEPLLLLNLPEYISKILKLPQIRGLNIITNGFINKTQLNNLSKIYEQCKRNDVLFHVSISLDGVGRVHDAVRGKPNAFSKTIATIEEIRNHQSKYCDSYDLSCTVVKQNVTHLVELDTYARSNGHKIKYRLGVENKRIASDKGKESYSVLYDKLLLQDAKEFFHYLMKSASTFKEQFKYFSIFSFLNAGLPRFLGCCWKDEGITMDSRGGLYFCAVASKNIGSLRHDSGKNIFFSDENIYYRSDIINNCCETCIHDYSGTPELKKVLYFFCVIFRSKLSMHFYRFRNYLPYRG